MSSFSIEKVKLKLNFVDYDGDITIPDEVIRKHLETAKTLIDSVFDPDSDSNDIKTPIIQQLYEECVTEYAKYLTMVSWAANAIDIEKTPGTWSTILDNERKILKSLLLRLIGDEELVDELLGDIKQEQDDDNITFPMALTSFNLLMRHQIK